MSTLPIAADERPQGHRGPRRLAIAGFLLFATGGAAAAAASFQTVKSDGFVSMVAGSTLGALLGADSSGGSGSMLITGVFILGFVAGAAGLALMLMAALWSIARLRLRHHAARSWDKMEPAVSTAGQRGRKALGAAADHTAPVLNAGSRRARSWMSKRRDTTTSVAAPTTSGPALSGLTAGDPLDTSLEADSSS